MRRAGGGTGCSLRRGWEVAEGGWGGVIGGSRGVRVLVSARSPDFF